MLVPPNRWYVVLDSRELGRKPLGVERFAQPMVFWRTADGQAHGQLDRCPHLGAALSGGSIEADRLVCPFHGFAFDASGQCVHIPANGRHGKIPEGMACKSFEMREQHGFVWMWWEQGQADYPALPFFPELATSGWTWRSETMDGAVHYTRAFENQLDVAHLAFVHRSTIGKGGKSFVDGPLVQSDSDSIKVWTTNAVDQGQVPQSQAELAALQAGREPSLHFVFPIQWLLHISANIKNLLAFVPVNEHTTRYYLRIYHRLSLPLIGPLFGWLMGAYSRIILRQDLRIIVTQTPPNSLDANQDRFIAADRAIITYRRMLAQMVKASDPAVDSQTSQLRQTQ